MLFFLSRGIKFCFVYFMQFMISFHLYFTVNLQRYFSLSSSLKNVLNNNTLPSDKVINNNSLYDDN